ncbi:hypothetical protein SHI21_19790 [Bacteriovorax sp. PP10]|uniref:Gram-positive cocci surface proteins LPxTG domain-containing protein n=1 Tax=Bacteriovorax antarcticus TaxID=3088717 RepID=A0ABU5VZJ8_9BACT|nr:hypothetical protein [Bacteriovorax sp. PP10]MEA9358489.1 hypothetical protein [Bacteriovorax sp. PP10]
MTKFIYHFLNSVAFASPGSGHSHADEDALASKIIGIVVILVISGIGFLFISKKKK